MNSFKINVLIYVLSKLKSINGKKAFQKIMYFINEALNLSYRYKWWAYGPFSKELYDDLDYLISLGYVEYDINNFILNATEKLKGKEISLESSNIRKINRILEKLKEYTNLEPIKLELLASIYFLRNSYSGLYDIDDTNELYEILNLLKRDKFTKEEIVKALNFVKEIEDIIQGKS